MWRDEQAGALAKEIESVLALLDRATDLAGLVRQPLLSEGRGLAGEGHSLFPLLPMVVCESVCGDYARAVPAAAARQFLMAAADVFDDIEDADAPGSLSARYGPAVAVNAATTLLILAEKAMTRLAAWGVPDAVIVRTMDVLNSFYVSACAGQHLDLCIKPGETNSEDDYLRIAGMKSASQTECACHIGALLGGANEKMIGKLSEFGYNLGMASQIANDVQGIVDQTDINAPKVTLPVIYALSQTDGAVRDQLRVAFIVPQRAMSDPAQVKDILFSCGAVHYSMVKLEAYRGQARVVLCAAKDAGVDIGRLDMFLE